LTLSVLVVGFCAIIIVGGYYDYNYYGLRESLIRSQYAHVQIYHIGYLKNEDIKPFDYLIKNPDKIIREIEKDKDVVVATPRVRVWGILNTMDGRSQRVLIRGVVPEKESIINTFITRRQGNELKAGDFDKAVVGGTLADRLKLSLGSDITVTTIDADGYQNAWFLRIKGIISSFSKAFDSILVKTPLSVVKELVNISGVQEIVVLLNKTENTDRFVRRLKRMIAKYGWKVRVRTWYESAGYYQKVVRYYSGYFNIILFIIAIVTFFTTLNTMLMAVFERITEFGTMRSFGMPGNRITRIMLLEGMFIAVLGIALGVLISFAITKIININGIYVAAPPGATTGFRAFILLKTKNFAIAGSIALIVSFISSIIAAGKIRKMSVIRQILYNDLQ